MPEWPQGWRFLDDGRAFCPEHKGELPFADSTEADHSECSYNVCRARQQIGKDKREGDLSD